MSPSLGGGGALRCAIPPHSPGRWSFPRGRGRTNFWELNNGGLKGFWAVIFQCFSFLSGNLEESNSDMWVTWGSRLCWPGCHPQLIDHVTSWGQMELATAMKVICPVFPCPASWTWIIRCNTFMLRCRVRHMDRIICTVKMKRLFLKGKKNWVIEDKKELKYWEMFEFYFILFRQLHVPPWSADPSPRMGDAWIVRTLGF